MIRWLIILLILNPFVLGSTVLPTKPKKIRIEKRADFRITYAKIRKNEGHFANIPEDRGGITYAGICYKYNKDWYGWRYVPKNSKHNAYYPEADLHVLDYYLTIWVREGFCNLKNQQVANYLFDMRVNIPAKMINKKIFPHIKATYKVTIDEEWVTKDMDNIDLNKLKKLRANYYWSLVHKNESQKRFIKHWLKRANDLS